MFFPNQLQRAESAEEINKLIESYEESAKRLRTTLFDLQVYTEGTFNYSQLEEYPVYYIREINDAIKRKNDQMKQQLEAQKGTKRTTF